jgi:hypothetical protein
MSIIISDPLALVAIQSGQVTPPAAEAAAAGASQLDVPQRAVQIGEPVPIVFGRRRTIDGIACGGVLISPGATEARFENDSSNAVTAYYHLVLSEGQIDSIAVKDVFQRSCRVGSHSQTYNRRAGTWTPGNTITQQSGYDLPEASYYCGTIGAYPGMSTLSFSVTIPDGFDQWKRQVHAFIRGGMHVPRLYDDITGASDNFADLVQWMLTNSGRVPTSLIDTVALDAAATFLEVNGFTCNTYITTSRNYALMLAQWAPYFLLCESNASGKRGLRPLLPTNNDGTLKTTAITPVFTFDEDYITPGSLEILYSNLADRRPFVAQMIWRQQLEDDFGIIRTAEVRYAGTADTGPYESHDLSEFCTREAHAVKVGAYILSKRVRTSHTLRFTARPQAHNTLVGAGDIIRVRLERQATTAGTGYHDFLYQVERITKTLAGDPSYECSHFPVDDQGRSLIALDVAAATGTGILLTSNKTGVGCDINSSTDNTIPAETFSSADTLGGAGGGSSLSLGNEGDLGAPADNPDDNLDVFEPHTALFGANDPGVGTALYPYDGPTGPCEAEGSTTKSITWFKDGVKTVTISFDQQGNETSRTPEPGQSMPTWLNAATPGILMIQSGGAGVYTSIVECWNGSKHGRQTSALRSTRLPNLVYGDEFLSIIPGGGINEIVPQWRPMIYSSFGSPSYVSGGSIFCITAVGDVIGNGGLASVPFGAPQVRTFQVVENGQTVFPPP